VAARCRCGEEAFDVRVCVPVTADGQVDLRWGRAERVAVAEVTAGEIRGWQEFPVGWGTLHDQGTEGAHHARVARFLRDNQVQAVAVHHVGPGMQRMLDSMSVRAVTGLGGDARSAACAAERP
jgi:predicted Fe-Mo cluster-binding NifX family protein